MERVCSSFLSFSAHRSRFRSSLAASNCICVGSNCVVLCCAIVCAQIKIMMEFPDGVELDASTDRKKAISPQKIHSIFQRISDDDSRALGLDSSTCVGSCTFLL